MFHIGQKVICIDNALGRGVALKTGESVPAVNVPYTIRDIFEWRGTTQLLLEEIINPQCRPTGEGSFNASRFRPIIERKTDIAIFTAMLTHKKVTEGA